MVANITCFLILYKSFPKEKKEIPFSVDLHMQLILDFGNTTLKYHLFNQGVCHSSGRVSNLKSLANKLSQEYPMVTEMIYADVTGRIDLAEIHQNFNHLSIQSMKDIKLPFTSAYTSFSTLGEDRIALVAAAVKKYPEQNCLIIDAGSCITYDLITDEYTYLGGAISPGVGMRFKSLHHFTGKLPLIEASYFEKDWGNNTISSISKGVTQGVIYEIEGQINHYREIFKPLKIILTGGDAQYLSKNIKNTIFAEPNFLAEGLNYLLEFNRK